MSQSTCSEPNQTVPVGCGSNPDSLSWPFGGSCHDTEFLHKVLAALKRHEAFLEEIERASSTGGFIWRAATGQMTCTGEVYRIFELDVTVPVTLQLLGTRVHPDDVSLIHDMIQRAQALANEFEYELRLRLSSQIVKYLLLSARRSEDVGDEAQYIGTIQDVTQRRVSEEALGNMRSDLARVARVSSLGILTASIAHEVNQPLSGIMTNASTCLEMLAADPPDIDGARETARRTIRDGERACEVIARLRALFGKRAGRTESVDLNAATRDVIALALSELQRRHVMLRTEFAEELPVVTGDRVQLQQVILNLLMNAAEAMSGVEDRQRLLLICTEPHSGGDWVRLRVQDAGVGFAPTDATRLFEPFYTTKSGGMGIGLSVSRSIIESHRGRLWAEPNAGPGATFVFAMPARETVGTRGPAKRGAIGPQDNALPSMRTA
jgi:C4-dicarboxylate-specific signal transduction histidine kinase